MKLENEFTVPAPVERVWPALLDIARVADCLPGAAITPGEDGAFRGRMKIKVGPVTTVYEGIARLQDIDDDTHTASIAVTANEAMGQGTASAVITNRLEPVNGGTRVLVGTDLAITGRQAQLGHGIMQEVARSMMEDFARRFEWHVREGGPPFSETAAKTSVDDQTAQGRSGEVAQEAFNLGNLLAASPQGRRVILGAMLLMLLVAVVRARRPKEIRLELRIRP